MKYTVRRIYKKIREYKNIVIARHIGPDPDAVASEIALRDSIKLTFPTKNVYAVGNHVSRFKYLGPLDKVNDDIGDALLIVVDNPVTSRLDGVDYTQFNEIIVIDHHPAEDLKDLSTVFYIDDTASSAAQLICDLILNTNLRMNKDIAEKLFVGIVADSDRFLLSYTSSKTFDTVSLLINKYQIDMTTMYNHIYERPYSEVKFRGYIATNLNITENGFGSIILDTDLIKSMDADISSASNMVNDFNYIKEMKVWSFATFDDKANLYRVNIRSRGPVINEVAAKYNGGGHKLASGARVESIEDVKKLFADLDKVCKEYNGNN